MLPRNVIYYGVDAALPEQIPLRAGPLSMIYENGDLRYIKLGDCEIIRRIYVAIRDRNWGTVPNIYSNVKMEVKEDCFHIAYDVENKQADIDFSWKGEITGAPSGMIIFRMDGHAKTTFWRNRIGFCVLHPAGLAGSECLVEHMDGKVEKTNLPEYLVSAQPVEPFYDMGAITHQVESGMWAKVSFSGDLFEMEDQRNWTDASFKTFCTPLRLGYPAEVKEGTQVSQTITVSLLDERPKTGPAVASMLNSLQPVVFYLDQSATSVALPAIGLGMASHGQPLSEREITLLKALNLHHLRIDLRLSDPHYPASLEKVIALAEKLNVSLIAALFFDPENSEAELVQFSATFKRLHPPISAWMILPNREAFKFMSSPEPVVLATYKHLKSLSPAIKLGAGTNADAVFLLREPPPFQVLDLVTFSINPQVHAFDNASMIETLEAQAQTISSVRKASGLPVYVGSITLKPRVNFYITGDLPPVPAGELPPQVDPRQISLFAAGWTMGSLKYISLGGAQEVTYYETTGWRGVMEKETGSELPERFPSLPGSVFPLYHVFADLAEFAGGQVVSTRSSNPLVVDGLAIIKNGRTRLLLANYGATLQTVQLSGLGDLLQYRILDETTADMAMRNPQHFHNLPGSRLPTPGGACQIDLMPFALARVDLL